MRSIVGKAPEGCLNYDCTRECLALVVDTSLSDAPVAWELAAIIAVRGVHR